MFMEFICCNLETFNGTHLALKDIFHTAQSILLPRVIQSYRQKAMLQSTQHPPRAASPVSSMTNAYSDSACISLVMGSSLFP